MGKGRATLYYAHFRIAKSKERCMRKGPRRILREHGTKDSFMMILETEHEI